MSVVLVAQREIGAPAGRVWSVLTDWDRQGDWIPATRVTSYGGHAVGGRIEARTGVGPLGFLDTMTITAWDPPRCCEVQHTGRLVRGPGRFVVDPLGPARARVTWEERLDLPLGRLGRAGWPLVRPLARAGLAFAMRRLSRVAATPGSPRRGD